MKCKYGQGQACTSMPDTICGMAVQLVFADKENDEIPEIVGRILKGSYLRLQSV